MRIAGEAAEDLQVIFDTHWSIASPEKTKSRSRTKTDTRDTRKLFRDPDHKLQTKTQSGSAALTEWTAEWGSELGTMDGTDLDTAPVIKGVHNAYVQTFEGNPGIPTQVIREAYFICLTQAAQTIDITNPYFVPDADVIMAMKTAVARGVRVRLLVPRNVVPRIVGPASRTYYGELLEAGVHIYLYNKGVLHAKLMIIDGEISEVGSSNYDIRSYRLNYEVCEVLYNADLARELTEQFERDLTDSIPLRIEDLLQRSPSQRILDQAARVFSPLL
jgi:cardiolipin synthase A/B